MTPEQLAALRAELVNDPAEIGYGQLLDAPACDAFNLETRDGHRDVPCGDIEGYMRPEMLVTGLEDWCADGNNDVMARRAGRELLGLIGSPHIVVVRMSVPAIRAKITAMLGVLVAAGSPITGPHRDALLALSAAKVSRATLTALPRATPSDIANARRL